jgi:hypothetical protein
MTPARFAWVTSGVGNRLAKYDIEAGRLVTWWGTYGTFPGAFDRPHYISVAHWSF